MKIFVINLDSREDRLTKTIKELKDFEWERFPAVNGYNMTAYDFASKGQIPYFKWKDPMLHRSLTNTELAAALSHYKLWEKCAELNENILVLEDDNIYNGGLNFDEIDKLLETYDIVFLDYFEMFTDHVIDIDDRFVKPCYPYWTNAYAFSPRLARSIIDSNFLNCIIPVDEFFVLLNNPDYNETCINYKEQFLELQDIYKNILGMKSIAYKQSIFTQIPRAFSGSDIEKGGSIMETESHAFHMITVATDSNKLVYLQKSAEHFSTYYLNIGEGISWNGGDMTASGGGQKINLIKKQLKYYDDNDIVLFVDGYDVFFCNTYDSILERFFGFNCDILFATEIFCWPDESLAYYFNADTKYKYLNSGVYIGYVKSLKSLVERELLDSDDDQLYFQKRYLETLSGELQINVKLDTENYIFQCLSGVAEDVSLTSDGAVVNLNTNCSPCVIHGNGGEFDKQYFNHLFHRYFGRLES